jgi:hypothetical protein
VWTKPTPYNVETAEDILLTSAPDRNNPAKPYQILFVNLIDAIKGKTSNDGATQYKTSECNILCSDGSEMPAKVVFWGNDAHNTNAGQVLALTNTSIKSDIWNGETKYTVHINGTSIVQPAHPSVANLFEGRGEATNVIQFLASKEAIGAFSIKDDNGEELIMMATDIGGTAVYVFVAMASLAAFENMSETKFLAVYNGRKYRKSGPFNILIASNNIATVELAETSNCTVNKRKLCK